ncbi:hypothetical protein [Nonomuraea sp. NPDC001831]|uniref:hypothetical protein n=1 Tax=Nonomuraea sp. NPDC001831 TaxID=3364340 RepID=UPI00368F410C
MARDENDRPYEDGQGKSLNPELTGDVLSPRWSTEDTDEQPAIQVSGNETYILPAGQGAQPVESPATPATPMAPADAPHDVLDGPSGPHDVLDGPSGSHEALSGPHETLAGPYESLSGPHAVVGADGTDVPGGDRAADDDLPYLPLDQGYKPGRDDDAGETRRGFLGSGWTDDADDRRGGAGRDREVRRRTRVLVLAAAAVVLVGAGAGWLLTGTSSDDPCGAGTCAGASQVTAPARTALPEETESAPAPEETDTAEPTVSETVTPTPVARRPRPTREPSVRPTATARESRPTATPEEKATHGSQDEMNETSDGTPDDSAEAPATRRPERQETAPPTQAPPAQQEQPAPSPSEKKGLFDILFPWA